MAGLGKANFHSVDICRLIKNNIKKDQRGKLIQTLIFGQAAKFAQKIFRRRNLVHAIEFSLHSRKPHKAGSS